MTIEDAQPAHVTAMTALLSRCAPDTCTAQELLTLVKLQQRVIQAGDGPAQARRALQAALDIRSTHPTAQWPQWRELYLHLMHTALSVGVPASDVTSTYFEARLLCSTLGRPAHAGEPLVRVEGNSRVFTDDLPPLGGGAALN